MFYSLFSHITRENAFKFQWIFTAVPILVCFIINTFIMFVMVRSVFTLQRKMNRLSNSFRRSSHGEESIVRKFMRRMSSLRSSQRNEDHNDTILPNTQSSITRPPRLRSSMVIRQSAMERCLRMQAILYLSSFLLTYIFTYTYRIVYQQTGSAPFVLVLLPRIFRPLQGLFNVIIYTRVRVSRMQSSTGYSWFRAFYKVVTSFDDHDDTTRSERRPRRHSFVFWNRQEVKHELPNEEEKVANVIEEDMGQSNNSEVYSSQSAQIIVNEEQHKGLIEMQVSCSKSSNSFNEVVDDTTCHENERIGSTNSSTGGLENIDSFDGSKVGDPEGHLIPYMAEIEPFTTYNDTSDCDQNNENTSRATGSVRFSKENEKSFHSLHAI